MLDTAEMWTSLPAKDFQRAITFYREKLDLKPIEENEYVATYEGFIIYPTEFAGTNKATAAGFNVDDIGATVDELLDKGVKFQDYGEMMGTMPVNFVYDNGEGMKVAWFTDSEGNIIALNEAD